MDRLSQERRSWNMSRIRSRNTRPEQLVRSLLHRLGFRFRLCTGDRVFGRPDIVLPKYRTVIFVHGCFWHRHQRCRYAYTPKSRIDFWERKFAANIARDKEVSKRLRREGWRVVIVWECDLARIDHLKARLMKIRSETHRSR
ncbi:MAG TPA: DNA mismatch endonuclease Vsr [Phycisphaerae bacterium]|nr:DNA mismatch endonuclease Vsr [Phycisphaerae bacterium]HPP29237.1 DNA mismatch endonuclease Vsr [Phycisphaerae bacterium]HPU35108.1 DNA mismatch endonuclease Vsr [Phycisphaerae bacterium]